MIDVFPDESILNIETKKKKKHRNSCIYFDGAVNAHGNGIGAILISSTGTHVLVAIKLRFLCTIIWQNMKYIALVPKPL